MKNNESIEIGTIRKTVQKLISKVIKNEDLQKKEINCFESLVSRRQFISGSAKFAGLGALACSGVVPSAWGRLNSDYSSNPADFGITQAEMAEEVAAYQFKFGTELFTQVVQDKPYSASHSTQGKHVALESFNGGQLKIQAIVDQTDPTEYGFNDYDSNFGTTEMAHLAEMESGWGIEILEKTQASIDSDEPSGGYDTTFITPTKFSKKLTGKETLYRLHHPLHNTLDSSGTKMLGVQAFLIIGTSCNTSYMCIRWLEAEASAKSSCDMDTVVSTGWDIVPLEQILPVNPTFHFVRTYTDVTGKDYITFTSSDDGSSSFWYNHILCIGGWKDIRSYQMTTQFSKNVPISQSTDVNIGNIVQINVGEDPSNDTFWVSLRGIPAYKTIHFPPSSTINTASKNIKGIEVYSEVRRQINKPFTTTELYKAFLQEQNQFSFTDCYEIQRTKATYPNGRTSDACIKIALMNRKQTTSSPAKSDIMLIAHDMNDGTFIGYQRFHVPENSFVADPILLTGGISKYGGFTFFAKDTNNCVLMYRQSNGTDSNTPYSTPLVDGRLTPPGTNASNVILGECPDFASTNPDTGAKSYRGIFIGNKANAIYCNPRFNNSCDMLTIEEELHSGSVTSRAYLSSKKQVETTWYKQPISQSITLEEAETENTEYQECYRATISPLNSYGYSAIGKEGQYVEIRSPSPQQILFNSTQAFDVDRSQGALIPISDKGEPISIMVKANDIACRLMVRVVDISTLERSNDSALLRDANSEGATTKWYNLNLAEQANLRMASSEYNSKSKLQDAGNKCGVTFVEANENSPSESYDSLSDLYKQSADSMNALNTATNDSDSNLKGTYYQDEQANNPLYTLHVSSLESLLQSSDNSKLVVGFQKGKFVRTSESNHESMQLQGIFGDFIHWVSDVVHAIANVISHPAEAIKDGFKLVLDGAKVVIEMSKNLLELIGQAVDSAVNWVVETCEQVADIVASIVTAVVKVVMCIVRAIIMIVMLFVHIKDIISTIKSAERLHDDVFDIVEEQTMLAKQEVHNYRETVDSAFDSLKGLATYQSHNTGVGNTVATAFSETIKVGQGIIDACINNPLVNDVIMPAISKLTEALLTVVDGVWDTISPILFKDIQFNEFGSVVNVMMTPKTFEPSSSKMEEFIAWFIEIIIKFASDPTALCDIVSEVMNKAIECFQGAVDWTFDLLESAIELAANAYRTIWTQASITFQIPIVTKFLKLFDIDLSTNISFKQLNSVLLGTVAWCTMYIKDGKSIKSLPSLKDPVQSGLLLGDASGWNGYTLAFDIYDALLKVIGNIMWLNSQQIKIFEKTTGTEYKTPPSLLKHFDSGYEFFLSCNVVVSIVRWAISDAKKVNKHKKDAATSITFDILKSVMDITKLTVKYKDSYKDIKDPVSDVLGAAGIGLSNMKALVKTTYFVQDIADSNVTPLSFFKYSSSIIQTINGDLIYGIDLSNKSNTTTPADIQSRMQTGFYSQNIALMFDITSKALSNDDNINGD